MKEARQPLPKISEQKDSYRNPWKWLAAIIIFIAGFSLTSQFINFNLQRIVTTLDIPALNPKLEDIKREGSQYDFVFIGSSRVFRGIDPVKVDEEARKLACNIKTYNFGIGGLSVLEQRHVLKRLHETGVSIDTIIIEPYSVSDNKLDGYISDRRRFFYTWDNLPNLILDQLTMPNNILYKIRNVAYLLFGFSREQVSVGRLSYLLFPQQPKVKDQWDKPIHRGHMPLDDEIGPVYDKRKAQFMRMVSRIEEKIEKAINNPGLRDSSGNRFELVQRIVNDVRTKNINTAIIFMPSPLFILNSRDLEDKISNKLTESLPIINLNEPAHYRDLFEIENYFDGGHLNQRGAGVLAKHLASELCALQNDN